jgi:hypothetical protein
MVYLFKVLYKCPCVASVSVGGVDTLGREVVQLFVVGVHDNFFLICVLEGLRTRYGVLVIFTALI